MKTNSIDLLELTPAESPWRSWLLRSWIIGSVLLTSFCVFKGLEASAPKPATTRQITVTEEVRRSKRMDEVQENDFVLARDEFGTEIGPRRVVQVHRRISDHLRLLTFEARDGTRQTIKTTDEHPFGCADSLNFIPAGQLPLGHQVPGPKGERQTLVASTREEHPEGIRVFNFEVEGFHTYYVAADSLFSSLLVHNRCETITRFGSADEAAEAFDTQALHLRPGHSGPKRVAVPGATRAQDLGSAKSYSHKITVEVQPGTTDWLRANNLPDEILGHDPSRVFAIPENLLPEFNDRIVNITIQRIR
jgi:hypothetical protein